MSETGPLRGIRVLDLSIAATGPYAVALLADQGAEVIKVERPGIGDIARWVGVAIGGTSALFASCNRGKRSIVVDVHTEEGRDVVRALAATCDVVVQNFRPGVVERLGLGYADLSKGRDDLVYVSLSGFGPDGPYAGKSAYDPVIQAYAGLAVNQADVPADGEPEIPVFLRQSAADKVTALVASQAITAALFARERGLGGQHVELSMLDAVTSFLWVDATGNEVLLDSDGTRNSSFNKTLKPIRFQDGWAVVAPTSDADFAGMCRAFGVEGHDDPRVATIGERMKHPELTSAFVQRCYTAALAMDVGAGMAALEAQRVPCGRVLAPAELPDDPHAVAVGLFEESVHAKAGRLRMPRHPAQFAGTPAALGAPSPLLGEHTDEVLAELGMADRITALRAAGVVG